MTLHGPPMRERSSPGVAIAATTPMSDHDDSSSNVNPRDERVEGIRLTEISTIEDSQKCSGSS